MIGDDDIDANADDDEDWMMMKLMLGDGDIDDDNGDDIYAKADDGNDNDFDQFFSLIAVFHQLIQIKSLILITLKFQGQYLTTPIYPPPGGFFNVFAFLITLKKFCHIPPQHYPCVKKTFSLTCWFLRKGDLGRTCACLADSPSAPQTS